MKIQLTHYTNKDSSGFSTIEILIAFSVGIIFLTAAMMVSFSDPTLARQISLDSGQAAALDVSLDNNALATSSNKLGNIVAKLTSNWKTAISGDSPNSTSPYTNTPDITDIAPCLKEISNATTWSTLGARGRQITFGTALGDMTTAKALGRGGCDPIPPSEWDNPETDNLSQANVSGADNGTDVAVTSIDGIRYAFITSNPTGSGTSKKEFTVIDVSDTNVQAQDVKATLVMDEGLLALTVVGDYAYVLNDDEVNHLQIIDLTNPEVPVKLSTSYTLPNITCNYNANNCQRIGTSITYYDGYIYIGAGYMVGNSPEFHIYCINDNSVAGCSPTTPVARGSLNVNHDVNDIAIKDTRAYLATSADYGELTVIDITSKTLPTLPPSYLNPLINNRKYNAITTSNAASTEDGSSIYILGDYAYLGRERVNNQSEREFYVLNISNPSAITPVGSMSLGLAGCNGNGCSSPYLSGIVVKGKTAFVGTTDSNSSFFLIDLSQPSNPRPRNNCSDLNTSQTATSITIKDNLVFLSHAQGSTLLKIIYDQGNACTQ